MDVVVLGCGVIGLSSAIRLREAGYDAVVWSREPPLGTTSATAGAIWYPYLCQPRERVLQWATSTLADLYLLAGQPESGVTIVNATEVAARPDAELWWGDAVRVCRPATSGELPEGYIRGWTFEIPQAEMPIYLSYLRQRFVDLGGQIVNRTVKATDDALAVAPLVVNCTGLGAGALTGDEEIYPVRGQMVRIAPLPRRRWIMDFENSREPTYILPRSGDWVLGGTSLVGDWSTRSRPATRRAIIQRCARLMPEIEGCRVLGDLVGLRPGRASVRCEVERRQGGTVIHNYGHGGAGLTLSWGCADEVLTLAEGTLA